MCTRGTTTRENVPLALQRRWSPSITFPPPGRGRLRDGSLNPLTPGAPRVNERTTRRSRRSWNEPVVGLIFIRERDTAKQLICDCDYSGADTPEVL